MSLHMETTSLSTCLKLNDIVLYLKTVVSLNIKPWYIEYNLTQDDKWCKIYFLLSIVFATILEDEES